MSKPLLAALLLAVGLSACFSDRTPERSPANSSAAPSVALRAAPALAPAAAASPTPVAAAPALPSVHSEAAAASSPALPGAAPTASASPRAAPGTAARVLVLGDSLSDPRAHGGGYLAPLSACGAQIENLARGGFMVNQMRRRFEALALPRLHSFDTLLVFGGVNDIYSDESAGRTVEKISADLSVMYRAAKAAGLRVIALGVAPWGGFRRYYNERRAASTRRLNDWLRAQRDAGLIDVLIETTPLLSCGDPELLCPELAAPFKDGLHFGKAGHARLAEALLAAAFPGCPR